MNHRAPEARNFLGGSFYWCIYQVYHSSAIRNNHLHSASAVLNVGIIKVAVDDSLVLYAALFGPRICGSGPDRSSNQDSCGADSDAAQRGSRQRVHVGICCIARSRTVYTSSMKTVETRTRTAVRIDQSSALPLSSRIRIHLQLTRTSNERRAVICPFTRPCQCARFQAYALQLS